MSDLYVVKNNQINVEESESDLAFVEKLEETFVGEKLFKPNCTTGKICEYAFSRIEKVVETGTAKLDLKQDFNKFGTMIFKGITVPEIASAVIPEYIFASEDRKALLRINIYKTIHYMQRKGFLLYHIKGIRGYYIPTSKEQFAMFLRALIAPPKNKTAKEVKVGFMEFYGEMAKSSVDLKGQFKGDVAKELFDYILKQNKGVVS